MNVLRFPNVKLALSEAAVHIRRTSVPGEFRVTLMEHRGTERGEAIAYYTDDLEDALLTGLHMRRHAQSIAA